MSTPAQDEFNALVSKNTHRETLHPEDRDDLNDILDLSEEDSFRNNQIDSAMRMPTLDRLTGAGASDINLPPASFDSGRATGVKGVIADARNYEAARKNKWRNRVRTARASIFGLESVTQTPSKSDSETDDDSRSAASDPDEEAFLQEWRETRRRQLESDANRAVRNRRTSPSVRIYGRLDEVDALGYLDAIEKVGRETTVVVFVYDHECEVSATIESAMMPLVKDNTAIHFVKVHYEEIEFDNAAVPAILAYRNQGDLFANLTGVIEMIPDDESFGTAAMTKLFTKHDIL
ncbi:hypothetical protein AK830_g10732 [Neonectria ditissima]|uniref:Phosducin domain-containing protein n=1 Tax=Neonectria ditissima TaxID=78410 RepID=A0A0P7B9U2_9HYPO|nr:hypothetical protein AK830_g10732 [Neonectria ditissima]